MAGIQTDSRENSLYSLHLMMHQLLPDNVQVHVLPELNHLYLQMYVLCIVSSDEQSGVVPEAPKMISINIVSLALDKNKS